MKKFTDLDISKELLNNLKSMGYEKPTEIQLLAIPAIIAGKDLLASSQTGTGKTAAFLIPTIKKIEDSEKNVLVVVPTRELAKQIYIVINEITRNMKINSALLIGGDDIRKQSNQLKNQPRIVVGTPGRINDHLERRRLKLHLTDTLVLDETDRMLDMGFGVQIDSILKHMPRDKQTILFSATFPKAITKIANNYLKDPEKIIIGSSNSIAEKIEQRLVETQNKNETLFELLEDVSGSILIFVRTQRRADKMKIQFKDHHLKADVLHGGLRQNARERVMKNFRNQKHEILVATDIAARGLDVDHIEYVINFDLPDNPEDYIHRIGRTARAEKTGIAISLLSGDEKHKWKAIQNFLDGKESAPVKRGRSRGGNQRSNGGKSRNFKSNNRNFKKSNTERKFDKKPFGKSEGKESFGKRIFSKFSKNKDNSSLENKNKSGRSKEGFKNGFKRRTNNSNPKYKKCSFQNNDSKSCNKKPVKKVFKRVK